MNKRKASEKYLNGVFWTLFINFLKLSEKALIFHKYRVTIYMIIDYYIR